VAFKCVAVDRRHCCFSVLDDTMSWSRIGKTSFGRPVVGPSGVTSVVALKREKCARAVCTFLICSGDYQGDVTLHMALGAQCWDAKKPDRELAHFTVAVQRNSVHSIPACLKDGFTVMPVPSFVYAPGHSIAGFEGMVAAQISRSNPPRRFFQPLTHPWSLTDMAACHGLLRPSTVELVAGWVEQNSDDARYYPELAVLVFDTAGNYRGGIPRCSLTKGVTSCDGRMANSEFTYGFFDSLSPAFFIDHVTVKCALDRMVPDIGSIALVMFSERGYPVGSFRRKFVRIVDWQTKRELMIFPVSSRITSMHQAVLIGGLVNQQGDWMFCPALRKFEFRYWREISVSGSQVWRDVMSMAGMV
jgi:hypothetical protein